MFAVKIFRRVSEPSRREEFLEEARFLRACDHPAIMRIFDEGTYLQRHPFVVAEYSPRTLEAVINTGTSTLAERLSFVLQILSALAYLDTRDDAVIHRDIKPANLFVKGRSCVLGDFGLMKRVSTEESESDREASLKNSVGVKMPLRHRTPDQVAYASRDVPLTTKSDIFQLGLVAAELFSGINPEKQVKRKEVLSPVELIPDQQWTESIPFGFRDSILNLIKRMLEMSPDSRPKASDLIDPWRGIFLAAAKQQLALEGRAF